MQPSFFRDLKRNQQFLKETLHLDENSDIVTRSFTAMGLGCMLYYVDGFVSSAWVADYVLRPLMHCQTALSGKAALDAATQSLIAIPETKVIDKPEEAVDSLMHGLCMVLLDTVDSAILMDARMYVKRSVTSP